MSKLDELITELCPDGVEYVRLAECCDIEDNKRKPVKSSLRIPGDIPYYGANNIQDYVEGYTHHGQYVLIAEDGSASLENYSVQYVDGFFWANNHVHVIKGRKDLDTKFLYYYLTSFNFIPFLTGGTRAKLNKGNMEEIQIPLPPLPVQQEIVRILDNFTELTAELTAELEARKKQYEYYRDKLFDFSNRSDVKYHVVGELFEFKNGLNKGKEFFGKGTPIVNFTDVFNNRYLTSDMLKGRVQVSDKEMELYSARKGDVFFTRTSETQEEIGMASTLIDDVDSCVFSGFVLRARPKTTKLLPKFCSYYFSTNRARREIIKYSTFTTRALTSGTKLSKLLIPVPSLEEQERIVNILDRFDALCNDLTSGLPAEIEARKKQYEYYRDKLLTFKELGA